MALKDILALVDDKLADVFHSKKPDPAALRAPAIKRLAKAKEQFLATEPARGRKIWRAQNNVVEVTLPFAVGGKTTHYVPSERFSDYLDKLRGAVEAGELDDELVAAAEGSEAPKSGRKSGGGARSGGWSEERKAEYREKMAAKYEERRKAKEAAAK